MPFHMMHSEDNVRNAMKSFVSMLLLIALQLAVLLFYEHFARVRIDTKKSSVVEDNALHVNVDLNVTEQGMLKENVFDRQNYTVRMTASEYGYRGQPYEMLDVPVISSPNVTEQTSTVWVRNHSWEELKHTVAFVILITSCEGVYAHQSLHDLVNVFFVSAQNDGLHEKCRHAIPLRHHVNVPQNVTHVNNVLKVNAGYNWVAAERRRFPIVFKMDQDCVLHLPKLKVVLDYMASHRDRSYYVGEMMTNAKFMCGMLYGVSDFDRRESMQNLALHDPEDVEFGKWMMQGRLTHRLNLAHLYFGRSKRQLLPSCEWLVIHNSPPNDVIYDFNCSHTYTSFKQFIDANIRNDHKKNIP